MPGGITAALAGVECVAYIQVRNPRFFSWLELT